MNASKTAGYLIIAAMFIAVFCGIGATTGWVAAFIWLGGLVVMVALWNLALWLIFRDA